MTTLAEKSIDTTPATDDRGHLLALWLMRGLAVLATAVCGFIVWVQLSGGNAAGCGGALDCSSVLNSEWSKWFGLPVSIPAFSMYASLMFVLLFAGPRAPEGVRKLSWTVVIALTGLAAAAGVYFVALQFVEIKLFCPWCITVHVSAWGLFLLTWAVGPVSIARKFMFASGMASVGMGVLIAGQHLQPEESGLIAQSHNPDVNVPVIRLGGPDDGLPLGPGGISMSDLDGFRVTPPETADGSDPAAIGSAADGHTSGEVDPPSPPPEPVNVSTNDPAGGKERLLRVLDNSVELNVYQYPVVGSYEADHVMVKLFDYTCPYCRKMHNLLEAAQAAYGEDIAVLPLAVPMNKECNPYIRSTSNKHADACELAALSLAVWRANASKFAGYHNWLMSGDHAPSIPDARAKAASLIGEEQLSAQLNDPQLWRRLAIGVEVYKMAKTGVVPKLLAPEVTITMSGRTMSGRAMTEEEFLNALKRHLKLEPPESTGAPADVLP